MKKPETPQEMIKWIVEDLAFIAKNHYVPDRTIELAEETYGFEVGERVDKELAEQELREGKEND
jgi:hypothetical protein